VIKNMAKNSTKFCRFVWRFVEKGSMAPRAISSFASPPANIFA